jgi:hypothetical protein
MGNWLPPKRPSAASPQGATLADRQSRLRGVCLIETIHHG